MEYIGIETTVEANGKTYKISRLERAELKKFLYYANDYLGNPLEKVKPLLNGFPPEIQSQLVAEASKKLAERMDIDSPEIKAFMATPDGVMKMIAMMFEKYHPELKMHDVEKIYDAIIEEHGHEYLRQKIEQAGGKVPKDLNDIKDNYLGITPNEKKG